MADAEEETGIKVEKDPILADINKRILDAFDIFDHDGNKTVDVRYESQIIPIHACLFTSHSMLKSQ